MFLCLCFCFGGGGVFVVVFLCLSFCGGVFGGVVFVAGGWWWRFLWWCFCVFVVVFLYVFFVKGRLSSHYREVMQRVLTALVSKDVWYKSSPYTAHIHTHIKHFLYLTVFIAFGISGVYFFLLMPCTLEALTVIKTYCL